MLQHTFLLYCSALFLSFLFRLPSFFLQHSFYFFFLPYVFKVQPFTCYSLTQPKRPKRFSAFQPKRFCFNSATLSSCFFCFILFWFSPKILHSAQNVFFFNPKYFFSSAQKSLFNFYASFFLFLFFLPFFSAFSHFVLPFFSPSVQLKTFFSCFMSLYLSKSSFSSNLK